MNNIKLSDLACNEYKAVGLCAVVGHMELPIGGVLCDDREANLSCVGVAVMECDFVKDENGKHTKIRVSDRITRGIIKEVKFTY